ncbi:MAG: hypothetical protein HYT19_01240, partial [Candidatus Nealsonbacteria bacterium]|nr:hypothetical protein [Candidatus Nealsonbacteria bacterium]
IITAGAPIFIVFVFANIAVILSYIFYTFSSLVLTWVTNDFFVSLPATSGGIVDNGLRITTGLVDLGFILVLVVIALATILRRESYGLKKLLPKFLFIVLIINFVPVITGAIIDIANIATSSFLPNIRTAGGDVLTIFGPRTTLGVIITKFVDASSGLNGWDWGPIFELIKKFTSINGLINMILEAVIVSFFGFFAGLVILLYALLFIVRIILLWLLVILAPLAWFCSILPNTQKFFKMWWNYFIQWAFVGAFAGFFLWLGKDLSATEIPLPELTYTGAGGSFQALVLPIIGIFNGIFVSATSIVFLLIGFVLSLKLSGGGTEMVLNWGNKGLKATGKWARGKAWEQTGQKWLASQSQRATLEQKGLLHKMAGAEWKDAKGWKKVAAAPFAAVGGYHAVRALGSKGLAAGSGTMDDRINKAKDNFKKEYGDNTDLLARSFSKDWGYVDRIAAGKRLIEEGDFNKLTPEQRKLILDNALSFSPTNIKDILRADPPLLDTNKKARDFILGNDKTGTEDERKEKAFMVMMEKIIRPKDIENYSGSFFFDPTNDPNDLIGKKRREYAILHWGPEYWNKIATNTKISDDVHNQLNETAKSIGVEKIAKANAAYLRFRASNYVGLTKYGAMEGAKTTNEISSLELGKPSYPSTPLEIEEKMTSDLRNLIKRHNALSELSFRTKLEDGELDIVEGAIADTAEKLGIEIPPNFQQRLRELDEKLSRGEGLTPNELALKTILGELRRPRRNNRQRRNR